MTTSLPTLTGSDKQVSWASQIRTDALAALDAYEASERADLALFVAKRGPVGPHVDDYEAGFAKIAEARARISAATSAAAIIDQRVVLGSMRRYCTGAAFPKAFAAALPLPA